MQPASSSHPPLLTSLRPPPHPAYVTLLYFCKMALTSLHIQDLTLALDLFKFVSESDLTLNFRIVEETDACIRCLLMVHSAVAGHGVTAWLNGIVGADKGVGGTNLNRVRND